MEQEEILQLILLIWQGKATEDQKRVVSVWLKENEEHQKLYEEYVRIYLKLHYTTLWDEVDMWKAVGKVKRKLQFKLFIFKRRLLLVGVAACLLLCLGWWSLFQNSVWKQTDILISNQIPSGERKAVLTLSDGSQMALSACHSVNIDLGTVAVTEDSISGLVYRLKDSLKQKVEYHILTVPRGGEYIMSLSDGTKVWLNSESEMKYPVVFENDRREIFITGEVFFEVAKDSLRPFIVHTPYTQTTVLGTSFNVMAYRDEQRTEITLVKGAVEVLVGNKAQHIQPGQQVQVNNVSLEMNKREVNVVRYASWKDGIFDFDGMTLEELVVKLSRWYDVDFFFVNTDVKRKRFTGAIKRNNTLQFMLDFIEKTSDVYFEVNEHVVRIYSR